MSDHLLGREPLVPFPIAMRQFPLQQEEVQLELRQDFLSKRGRKEGRLGEGNQNVC